MTESRTLSLSRRRALQLSGGLLVSLSVTLPGLAADAAPATSALSPDELDSWIAIGADGRVTVFFGKVDVGQGLDSAIAQMVAEELDVPLASVAVVMGDTALTCNQGGASGSTGVQRGGVAISYAAAEARRLLIVAAAERLHVSPESLETVAGFVRVTDDPRRSISYAELVGGRHFRSALSWNGKYGNELTLSGSAKLKPRANYTIVGRPSLRPDIAAKVRGAWTYVTDVTLPGMLHGRMLRPEVAGALPLAVDARSIAQFKDVRIVHRDGFLGVVAADEWEAIRAADALKVTWSEVRAPFPENGDVYGYLRQTSPIKTQADFEHGDVHAASLSAPRELTAEYGWPFQSHASMAPACAVADVRADGARCWSATQKPHFLREAIAGLLKIPSERVRVIWTQGPGSYGHNDAGDAAADAAVLSQTVGRPVRVQGMRYEGTAWDPKGPASIHRMRAALDHEGQVLGFEAVNKGFSRWEVSPAESEPGDTLAGMLLGHPVQGRVSFGTSADVYDFPNRRLGWECVPAFLPGPSPLRCSHLRDPLGPQNQFATECFLDEIAHATGADPVALRLSHMTDPRNTAVIEAVAKRAAWRPGPPGTRRQRAAGIARGMGMAFVRRAGTAVATVAEVEVDLASGRIYARRFVVAHDCGLIINPQALRLCIEGNVMHGLSRALCEAITFDRNQVTSRDWLTYPVLDITDAPEEIDILLIDRPDLDPQGAGEASTATVAAAVGNAVFDATGVRLRIAPMTRDGFMAAFRQLS